MFFGLDFDNLEAEQGNSLFRKSLKIFIKPRTYYTRSLRGQSLSLLFKLHFFSSRILPKNFSKCLLMRRLINSNWHLSSFSFWAETSVHSGEKTWSCWRISFWILSLHFSVNSCFLVFNNQRPAHLSEHDL